MVNTFVSWEFKHFHTENPDIYGALSMYIVLFSIFVN
jgi:hypothetical protein